MEVNTRNFELQEEEIIDRATRKFAFDCPHCHREINETHFGEREKTFQLLKERFRKVMGEEFNSHKYLYNQQWLKQIEEDKSYEKFSEVVKDKRIIEELKKQLDEKKEELAKVKSSDEIEKLDRVKDLKEKIDKIQKEREEQEKIITELKSSEYIENLERVRKLVEENSELRNQNQTLRDQGRMSKKKGEDFEQYVLEEISRVFDNKDKISKITQKGEKADFLQEVLTENDKQVAGRIIYEVKNEKKWDPKWVSKLENDMANEKADFGIIIAICENGKPLRCLDPRKKIYVSDDEQFVYIAKIMRDSLIQKYNYLKKGDVDEDSREKRIKQFNEWVSNKFPQYLSRLESELVNLKKNSYHADKITEITRGAEINIRKIILEEVRIELSNLTA